MNKQVCALAALSLLCFATASGAAPLECTDWQAKHPEWLWCDDFESDASLTQNYFDVERVDGRFGVVAGPAVGGVASLRGTFAPGVAEAGSIKLSLGKTPVSPTRYTSTLFDDLYWRFYLRTSSNWTGNGIKVTRGTVFSASNWSQAAIGHLWEDSTTKLGLGLDPASGVVGGLPTTTKYNDFDHLRWLGKRNGATQIYAPEFREKWTCVEVRMKLNTPGQANGELTHWVNDRLEASATALNLRGSYTTYGINAIMLENFINDGAPQSQTRYFDNFVVSKSKIGCAPSAKQPNPPINVDAQ